MTRYYIILYSFRRTLFLWLSRRESAAVGSRRGAAMGGTSSVAVSNSETPVRMCVQGRVG